MNSERCDKDSERCNDIEKQNLLAKFSLTLYRELKVLWGKKFYVEWCSRKNKSGITWLLAKVWQLKGIKQNAVKGRCTTCSEKEDAKHVLLDSRDTRNWRRKLINEKWLNMNKEVAYRNVKKHN